MGKSRRKPGRQVDGILLVDKPSGITSNDTLQRVKRLFNARKAGHTGSLDKAATGLLALCFGEATKISNFLLDANKRYSARCRLGIETTTGDAAGEVLQELPVPLYDTEHVEQVLAGFRGTIQQVPPMYSALKHKGQRLYKLAYAGQEVERQARPVTIFKLELLRLEHDLLDVDIVCSKGTYVRTLAEDIGKKLGCGAHVETLRRTALGPYEAADMRSLEYLEDVAGKAHTQLDSLLLGADSALPHLPVLELIDSVVFYLLQGQAVTVGGAPPEGLVRLYNKEGLFLGLGEVQDDGRIAPKRLLKTVKN